MPPEKTDNFPVQSQLRQRQAHNWQTFVTMSKGTIVGQFPIEYGWDLFSNSREIFAPSLVLPQPGFPNP